MDYQAIWFFLWGLCWAVFFITDGFDFGIGTLLPVLGKTEDDKRTMINAMGPLWDGNEVWLITAGGVTFAAFPMVYAVMFSSLYTALMLLLFSLILRGVAFEFRGKIESNAWRKVWDTCIFLGSFLPALLLGVAFGNIFKGIPFNAEYVFQGNLFTLLNPYGLLAGILFVMLFLVHGGLWLSIRSEGDIHDRAVAIVNRLWPVLVAVAVIFLIASYFFTKLFDNYFAHPILFLVIIASVAGLFGIKLFVNKQAYFKAWFSSALAIICCTFYGVIGLFPALFPSSINPEVSLTLRNASSSPLTLKIMLIVVLIFLPIVIVYQAWAYTLFKHKITKEELSEGYGASHQPFSL
jgi:cytochrome bd ubiquinol oxidase subunit II